MCVINIWVSLSDPVFQILYLAALVIEQDLGSISPTFYARLFCTKVSREAFLFLQLRLNFLFAQEYWCNCTNKMFVKLTPYLSVRFLNGLVLCGT
jgi:hypothetical protein